MRWRLRHSAGVVLAGSTWRANAFAEPATPERESRVVAVRGSPRERGRQLGAIFKNDIHALAAVRRNMYGAHACAEWTELSDRLARSWQQHAPVSWEEMEGMVRSNDRRQAPRRLPLARDPSDGGCRSLALAYSHGAKCIGPGGERRKPTGRVAASLRFRDAGGAPLSTMDCARPMSFHRVVRE